MYTDEKTPASPSSRTIDNPGGPGWVRRNLAAIVAALSTGGLALNGVKSALGSGDPVSVAIDAVAKLGFPTALAMGGILWFFARYLPRQEAREEERYAHLRVVYEKAMELHEARAEKTAEDFHDAISRLMGSVAKQGERLDALAETVGELRDTVDHSQSAAARRIIAPERERSQRNVVPLPRKGTP